MKWPAMSRDENLASSARRVSLISRRCSWISRSRRSGSLRASELMSEFIVLSFDRVPRSIAFLFDGLDGSVGFQRVGVELVLAGGHHDEADERNRAADNQGCQPERHD